MNISRFLKPVALFASAIGLMASCSKDASSDKNFLPVEDLTQYVDPYIGTGEHGHVFLGANVPFGLVQVGPTNISEGWDWVSGYHISDSTIFAFSHMHLSGTGIGDLLDVNFMPVVGQVPLGKGKHGDYTSGMYSNFKRDTEKVKPGYYTVHLDRYNVDVELTATKRVAFHKYTFPQSNDSRVVIDLAERFNWDNPAETYLIQENDSVVSGYRYSKGWANDQRIYFTAIFSKPSKGIILTDDKKEVKGKSLKAQKVVGQVLFDTKEGEDLYIKVALSPTSIENAKLNLNTELNHWDFNKVVADANQVWNKELDKIEVFTTNKTDMVLFYTAMYHTMIAPSEYCDVNGDYLGVDKKVYTKPGFTNYTTFSLWDTYRAANPLMSIIHPDRFNDVMQTFLNIYKQQGRLPVWHLMGCETDCMVGNPGVQVLADAMMKGFDGFDQDLAYEALKQSMMNDDRGLNLYKEYMYIPYDKYQEQTKSVHNPTGDAEGLSYAMEYAIGDWSVAQVAKKLNKMDDYEYFMNRSKTYKHYFDKETGFIRGKDSEGNFRPNFDPFHSTHRANDYTEGNGWQYTWLVPHDILGLAEEFGGKEKMIAKLDSLFIVEGDLGENASPDISGLVGQYAHGNEPSHHIIYMYPYLGQPWKAAEKVRQMLSTMYSATPEGIAGNEDVGQISAWYILSALGFYQVEPAGGKYVFGSPIVDKAIIKVKDNKTFTIIAKNNSDKNIYIQSVKLNGKDYDKFYIMYDEIEKGGTLEFVMGDKPSKFGV